jgi:hypothetical protein
MAKRYGTTLELGGQATLPAGRYGNMLVLAACDGCTLVRLGSGSYVAGCRQFPTARAALAHWNRTDMRARTWPESLRVREMPAPDGQP